MKDLNVLYILPEYIPHSGGGISTYYMHHIAEIKKHVRKLKVVVGSGYTQDKNTFNHEGVDVEYLLPDIYQKYLNLFERYKMFPDFHRNLASAWAMWEQSRKGDSFDIIECTDFGLGFVPWLCNRNKKVIVRLHGSSGQIHLNEPLLSDSITGYLYRQVEYSLLKFSDLLITHSMANKEYWNKVFSKDLVEFLPPIYSPSRKPIIERKDRDQSGIVCGRIQKWKGPEVLCQALQYERLNEVKINWYGRDHLYNKNTSMSEFLRQKYPNVWGKKIVPRKPLPNQFISEVQRNSTFALVTSTWDMFNFTTLEYMEAGTPVICSSAAGASFLIEDGVNGFTYESNAHNSLAKKIKMVFDLDDDSYQKLILKARDTISEKLSPSKLAIENMDWYYELLNKPTHSSRPEFITSMYIPDNEDYKYKDFLGVFSLKCLLEHIVRRIIEKIFKK